MITGVPTITAFISAFNTKALKLHGIAEILLGWRERDYYLPQAN